MHSDSLEQIYQISRFRQVRVHVAQHEQIILVGSCFKAAANIGVKDESPVEKVRNLYVMVVWHVLEAIHHRHFFLCGLVRAA